MSQCFFHRHPDPRAKAKLDALRDYSPAHIHLSHLHADVRALVRGSFDNAAAGTLITGDVLGI
jgi:hypothetical protein